jgi:5'-nucleotidase
MEAAIGGIPSLAISLEVDKELYHSHSEQVDFRVAAHFARVFARRLLAVPLPYDVDLLKVDVPADATVETAWEMTRQSRNRYFVALPFDGAPLGEPVRFDYTLDPFTSEPGTDTHVLAHGRRVSVTPLSFDLTSRTDLEALGQILSNGASPSAT